MEKLFEHVPEIIRSVDTILGFAALVVLALAALCYLLFRKVSPAFRLASFAMVVGAFGLLVAAFVWGPSELRRDEKIGRINDIKQEIRQLEAQLSLTKRKLERYQAIILRKEQGYKVTRKIISRLREEKNRQKSSGNHDQVRIIQKQIGQVSKRQKKHIITREEIDIVADTKKIVRVIEKNISDQKQRMALLE